MTQKEAIDLILVELAAMKSKLPNGELVRMAESMEEMKEDISELKYMLLNPEDGVIVKVNKNSDFRKKFEINEKEFDDTVKTVEELRRFKETVTKALWIVFAALAGIVIRIIIMGGGTV